MKNVKYVGFTGHRDRYTAASDLSWVAELYPNAVWIHGGAEGFDSQVDNYCTSVLGQTPVRIAPDYRRYADRPKFAPVARNKIIVDFCDVLVACYDGRTFGGTFDTIRYAEEIGKPVVHVQCLSSEESKRKNRY